MAKINFYLLFNGNCEEAFNFYKSAFGIDFTFIGRYGDIPPQNGMPPISEDEKNKIENAKALLDILGDETIASKIELPLETVQKLRTEILSQ